MIRHYLLEGNVAGTKMNLKKEISKQPATPSKYTSLGTAIAAELMIGFWFGIRVILAIGIVDCFNYCIGVLTSGK